MKKPQETAGDQETPEERQKRETERQTNETLLQSYRQIFISFEAFLLAVGAIVIDKSLMVMAFITAVGVATIWTLWFRIVRSRHLIVDYYKYNMKVNMDGECNSEEDYVKNPKIRKQAINKYESKNKGDKKIRNGYRPTRFKVDLVLPILFTVIWIVLLYYAIFTCLISPDCYLKIYLILDLLRSL